MPETGRPSVPVKARLYMTTERVTESTFRVGCATPGPGCQEYPIFFPTLDEARDEARRHAEDREHVSNIQWVQTTPIEVWACVEPPTDNDPPLQVER